MGSNTFGKVFQITTFGESHGPAIGVVIDGCPAGLSLSLTDIEKELFFRRPGNNSFTSPRKEEDKPEILSGVFEGKTTGAPIAILIKNKDADSSSYESTKDLYRPGHANFTYLEKYGIFDYKGGGRASARETAARVAAGAVAKKLLSHFGVECVAFLQALGGITINTESFSDMPSLRKKTYEDPIFCPDKEASFLMQEKLKKIKEENDSLGGIVACIAHVPAGLGDPVYAKLEAELAYAMLSIPACKGFEIGSGFASSSMKGSMHNDPFTLDEKGNVITATNFSGGTLGGISTGSPIYFKVAFKPTSSIKRPQETISISKEKKTLIQAEKSRHDPCVAIRAVPVVEAMAAITICDAYLKNRLARL